jgi:putative transposase
MYRILSQECEVRDRRNQARRPIYTKPELLATAPNKVWSWDITKLKGPVKGELFYVYTIIDIFSRYVVGWTIARRENAENASKLFRKTIGRQRISKNSLQIHSDRGAPMKAKTFVQLLAQLGVEASYSRPYVSNDNPYSESHFKTMKYQPGFPQRFGSFEDAEAHCRAFFEWYNNDHYHSGIALMTPHMVHFGQASSVSAQRQAVLDEAYAANKHRFVNGPPQTAKLPAAVWINPPLERFVHETTA